MNPAEIPADGGAVITRYQQILDYVNPYASRAYELASGHVWDRLAAIAAEFDRGELTWEQATALADDTTAAAEAEAEAARADR